MKNFLIIIVFLCNIGCVYGAISISNFYSSALTKDTSAEEKDKPLFRTQFDFGGTQLRKYGSSTLLYYGGIGRSFVSGRLYIAVSGAYRKKNILHPYPNLGSYNGEYTDFIGTFDIGIRLAKTIKLSPVLGLSYVHYLNKATYTTSNNTIKEFVGEGYQYEHQKLSPYFRIDGMIIDNVSIFVNYRLFRVFDDLTYSTVTLGANYNL